LYGGSEVATQKSRRSFASRSSFAVWIKMKIEIPRNARGHTNRAFTIKIPSLAKKNDDWLAPIRVVVASSIINLLDTSNLSQDYPKVVFWKITEK
jgi:hypothetical protein